MAERAAERIRPLIQAKLGTPVVGGRKIFCYVVLNPSDGSIVHEEAVGEDDLGKRAYYRDLAYRKARQSWRTGLTGSQLKSASWLYEDGDVKLAGGVVEYRLAVGGSGFQEKLDEPTSWLVFNAMAEVCAESLSLQPPDRYKLGMGEQGMVCPDCDSTNIISLSPDTTEHVCLNCGVDGEALEFSQP